MTDKEAARQLFKNTMDAISRGSVQSFAPLVSMFSIRDTPMTLDKHYQLLPMYSVRYSEKMVFMVARQLGKSTNICSSSDIRSSCIPHYHTLMIQPRFEQIQRMNNTIYVPMAKNCAIYEDFISKAELDRLALKRFKNGSMTLMSNMYMSPDRIRGVSGVGLVVIDECVSGTTEIMCIDDSTESIISVPVSDIKPGYRLISFGSSGIATTICTNGASYRGIRGCYKVTTKSGRYIECTEGHQLPTDKGPKRLSEIVSDELARRSTENRNVGDSVKRTTGDHDGGRMHISGVRKIGESTVESWGETAPVPTGEVHNITRVRHLSTYLEAESRLREHVVCLTHKKYADPEDNTFNTGERKENNNSRILRSDNTSYSTSLVVHGRRDPDKEQYVDGFFYDPIINIEYIGDIPVYDIEALGTHNYILSNGICSYNCQDINYDFLPIVAETMSASELWATMLMAGTPLTTDTTLGLIWDQSSQAEWVIKCMHCNQYNIPNPVHDLEHMIGKYGCICAKCGKDVNPINGCYVHAIPSRQFTFPGYHVSQTIHPLHCLNPRKWMDLLGKVNSYSQQKLYNEVFGWPYDISVMPLTRKDVLDSRNKHKHADYTDISHDDLSKYKYISVGIDFDGGGALSMSYTNLAVCGLRKDSNVIDCIYCRRYPKGRRVKEVADHIMSVVHRVNPNVVAYDAGGAGFVYRQILADQGLEEIFTMPFKYSSPSSGDVIKFHKGNRDDNSYYYSIDKSRSLAVIIEAVKGAAVTNPWFEENDPDPVPMELLSLVEQPKETPSGGIIYLIGRKSSAPDDYAHALNFACSAIWDHFRNYPKLGVRYDISIADDENEGAHKIEGELWGDPNDWNEFRDSMNGPIFTEGGF